MIALKAIDNRAAVGIVVNIAIVGRLAVGIIAVQEHIGFTQTAANQTGQDLTTGAAPQGEGIDQLAAGGTLLHSIEEIVAGLADPTAAAVICKSNQCVKLTLCQGQTVLINKLFIEGIFCTCQIIPQKRLCFFLGNTVGFVFLQHVIGAAGAVTDGILGIIPIGLGGKTFFIFQKFHQGIAGLHFRGSVGCRGANQHQTCKQHNCQQ